MTQNKKFVKLNEKFLTKIEKVLTFIKKYMSNRLFDRVVQAVLTTRQTSAGGENFGNDSFRFYYILNARGGSRPLKKRIFHSILSISNTNFLNEKFSPKFSSEALL